MSREQVAGERRRCPAPMNATWSSWRRISDTTCSLLIVLPDKNHNMSTTMEEEIAAARDLGGGGALAAAARAPAAGRARVRHRLRHVAGSWPRRTPRCARAAATGARTPSPPPRCPRPRLRRACWRCRARAPPPRWRTRSMRSRRSRTVAVTAVADSPVAARRRRRRRARLRRRALGRADPLRDHGAQRCCAPTRAFDVARRRRRRASAALDAPLPVAPGEADRVDLPRPRLDVGLASEAALKLREAAQAWTEAYPAFEYRHGPISVAGPGAASSGSFGPPDEGLVESVARRRRASSSRPPLDPLAVARARPADRRSRSPRPPGSTPTARAT